VTTNLDWGRLIDRVAATTWVRSDRVQLLMRDDGDTYFRLYMLRDGALRNVVPPPEDEGYDRPW